MTAPDYLIVGAGIIGLSLAKTLLAQNAGSITIIDKESSVAKHASGRNSGVLHAGIYYPADSLKAKFCLQGSRLLKTYCHENRIAVNNTGKVIVTRKFSELPTLYELEKRARANGAAVDIIDKKQLADIEPWAKTVEKALYSRETAVVNPKEVMQTLFNELQKNPNITFHFDCQFIKPLNKNTIITSQGKLTHGMLINAAGAYADTIAKTYGIGKQYCLIPFKGLYKKLKPEHAHKVTGNIYPVPNMHNPFLGVHFTKGADGSAYIGPTAIPAFGREHYGIIKGISKEAVKIFWYDILLVLSNAGFRHVAFSEPKKYFTYFIFKDAKKLVKELELDWLDNTHKVGIRPQLIDLKQKKLMMDFLVEKHENTVHILNAISPAFTSSMAFCKYVIDHYIIS